MRLPLRSSAGAIAAAIGLLLTAISPVAAAATTPKVLVIGIDGLLVSKIAEAKAPTLQGLQRTGTDARSLLYAGPMAATSSGPGWSTILTGTWPDQHGVKENSFSGNRLAEHPDWLSRVEAADPGKDTWAAMDWKPIGDRIIGGKLDTKIVLDGDRDGYVAHDATIVQRAEAHLTNDKADASFVYLGQQDIVGHNNGAASPEYLTELARMDGYVKRLLDAVAARATRAQEKWLVLVTTDHGHTPGGGHGGPSLDERSTFVLATGDGVPAAKPTTTRLVDAAHTALTHLGVTPDAKLAGRSLFAPVTDAFEGARLKPAQTENIPASVLGWTQELPGGWSVDNAAMPAGGVPEWRGWTLTTDAFWSLTQGGQHRETFVRGRGVIAVADSDEWADTTDANGKKFDSTLWAPADTGTGSKLKVDLTHYYRQEGGQLAQLLLQVDGGTPTEVRKWTADTAGGRESVTVQLPSGAKTARIGLRLSGVNNWYWAVDEVSVTRQP
ncbi:alkaline phosphatase family protein [Crossiella sp. CA-258035]|uniref:alkaline phosphatase family protein n=1 Tax=Crossiella sp. CA-258035 TaxID=2981138 RepID=UPI0024BD084D|nr:alkaline phosphatase family protein [Crossiella sp. CA-258035]WHT17069.1 alkaline phosphatase family protein [Crossiella sp. CA-258035]